ncbi:hypothetical protein HMPRNC0000_1689 [Staphylococcus aureus]|nr:hypothetical protein HMPRNC0000_1689 [Staphylococcus aureus]
MNNFSAYDSHKWFDCIDAIHDLQYPIVPCFKNRLTVVNRLFNEIILFSFMKKEVEHYSMYQPHSS